VTQVDIYEKLGVFYLGRPFDSASGETAEAPLLYDSKDLTTHAVCVGMTGSGKTGLCVTLLEEAAIDGIPALVIDVKGDLGNLLLTFPELRGEDFRPWIQEDEASRAGVSPEEWAERQAELWRSGLASWGQDGERIRRLREAADFAIYTPGSEAGRPVSILSSFGAPPEEIREDNDLLSERIGATVASLLGLLGIDADPLRSREHILLSNLLDHVWRAGQDLDLAGLIAAIQKPPMERVGVMPLETFFPADDRFELAMAINNLLAAPGFKSWLEGEPLDVDRLLFTPEGRPRVAIFSIAHLNDAERMFFVSLLLNQTLGWMRGRSGTSSLRALLYMDEVFGYLPPVANPPSKRPLLTMLKQARAFGVGVILATQNPVDLDYKALSNIGTWFLGRLQTERDKARVLDGLEGAAEGGFDRGELERLLSGLGKRVFLLHNVHEERPVLYQVRWALSYLAGPLARTQIQRLVGEAPPPAAPAEPAPRPAPRRSAPAPAEAGSPRPLLPPEVPERFAPGRSTAYVPHLLGLAEVHYLDRKYDVETHERLALALPLTRGAEHLDWEEADALEIEARDLSGEPAEGTSFAPLPEEAAQEKSYKGWEKALDEHLYRNRRFEILECPAFELASRPGESERDFRIRAAEAAREERDEETEKLRKRQGSKIATQERRVERAAQKVERESQQASEQKLQAALSVGSSILGAFFGRKKFSATKVRSAARGIGRGLREGQDVEHAREQLASEQERLSELLHELEREIEALGERFDPHALEITPRELKPRRTDVAIELVCLCWMPVG